MRRFAPPLISGWITEEFSRADDECIKLSRGEALDQIGAKLGRFMPGDSYSDLTYKTAVSWESLDPILVPVWVFAVRYRDDKDPLRVLINGQTGEIAGKVPLSRWKIVLAILGGLAAIAAIGYALHAFANREHAVTLYSLRDAARGRRSALRGVCAAGRGRPAPPSRRRTPQILRCTDCGAAIAYDANKQAPACGFCGAVMKVEQPIDPIEVAQLRLPFSVDRATKRCSRCAPGSVTAASSLRRRCATTP